MELQRYFGIFEPLTEKNADEVFVQTQSLLAEEGIWAVGLMNQMKVEVLCTTDGQTSDLTSQSEINHRGVNFGVLPTYWADNLICAAEPGLAETLHAFGARLDTVANSFESLFIALDRPLAYFKQNGCVAADHSVSVFDIHVRTVAAMCRKGC